MALFSRTPSRKPAPKAIPDPRAIQHSGVTGAVTGFSLTDAAPTCRVIEVSQVGEVLGVALENAVLLHASGHADAARVMLAEGIDADPDTSRSRFAWWVLFDLLQRAGDRDAYDRLALRYVIAFECTAPPWDQSAASLTPDRVPASYVALSGTLTAQSHLLHAVEKALSGQALVRLDLAGVTDFDAAGAMALANLLAQARQQRHRLDLQRPETLVDRLAAACQPGRAEGEGAWLLYLELLQWRGFEVAFDERAIDYAVTFEVSPPSWNPPVADAGNEEGTESDATVEHCASATAEMTDNDVIAWNGVIAGGHPELLEDLGQHAARHAVVTIDMARVERIDFAAAGACFNAIRTLEGRGKSVRIVGATPVIQAILRLLGLGPDCFDPHPPQA